MEPKLRKPEPVDLWHFIVGLASALLPVWWWRILAIIFYTCYQVLEKESTLRTVRDLVMFIMGVLVGIEISFRD